MKLHFLSFSWCFLLLQLGLILQATLAFGEEDVTSSAVVPEQDEVGKETPVEGKAKVEVTRAVARGKRESYYGYAKDDADEEPYDGEPENLPQYKEEAPTDPYHDEEQPEGYDDNGINYGDDQVTEQKYVDDDSDGSSYDAGNYETPQEEGEDVYEAPEQETVAYDPGQVTYYDEVGYSYDARDTLGQAAETQVKAPENIPEESKKPQDNSVPPAAVSENKQQGAENQLPTVPIITELPTDKQIVPEVSASDKTHDTTQAASEKPALVPADKKDSVQPAAHDEPGAKPGGVADGGAVVNTGGEQKEGASLNGQGKSLVAAGMALAYNNQYNKGSYKSAATSSSYKSSSNSYQQNQEAYQTSSYKSQPPSYKSKYQQLAPPSPVYAPSVPSAYSKPYPVNKYEQNPAQVHYGQYQAPDDDDGDDHDNKYDGYSEPQLQVDDYQPAPQQVGNYDDDTPSQYPDDDQYTAPPADKYDADADDDDEKNEDTYSAAPYDADNDGYADSDPIYEKPPAAYEGKPYQQQKYPKPAEKPYQQPANEYGDDYDDHPCQKKKKYPGKEKYEAKKEKYAPKPAPAPAVYPPTKPQKPATPNYKNMVPAYPEGPKYQAKPEYNKPPQYQPPAKNKYQKQQEYPPAPQEEESTYDAAPVAYLPKKAEVYKTKEGQKYSTPSYGKPGMQQKEAKQEMKATGRSFFPGAFGGGFGGFGAGLGASATTLIVDDSGSRRSRRRSRSRRSRSSRGRNQDRQTIRDLQAQLAALQRRLDREQERRQALEAARDRLQDRDRQDRAEAARQRRLAQAQAQFAQCVVNAFNNLRNGVNVAAATPAATVAALSSTVTAAVTSNPNNCVQPVTT